MWSYTILFSWTNKIHVMKQKIILNTHKITKWLNQKNTKVGIISRLDMSRPVASTEAFHITSLKYKALLFGLDFAESYIMKVKKSNTKKPHQRKTITKILVRPILTIGILISSIHRLSCFEQLTIDWVIFFFDVDKSYTVIVPAVNYEHVNSDLTPLQMQTRPIWIYYSSSNLTCCWLATAVYTCSTCTCSVYMQCIHAVYTCNTCTTCTFYICHNFHFTRKNHKTAADETDDVSIMFCCVLLFLDENCCVF